MVIQSIFYNHFSNRDYFELTEGKRPWDIFLLLTEGSFSCRIGEQEFQIKANEIAYFPMNIPFTREIISPISFHQLAFHAEHAHSLYTALTYGKLSVPREHVQSLSQSLSRLSRLPDAYDLLPHMIEHIMAEHTLYKQSLPGTPQGFPEDILATLRYMNDHLAEKLDIDGLAAMAHLSHVGFLWKFKRYTGTTPSQYLIRLRLNYAKQALLEGSLPINEIATACGYGNPYYFSNAFRKHYGMSPGQFRSHHLYRKPVEETSVKNDVLTL